MLARLLQTLAAALFCAALLSPAALAAVPLEAFAGTPKNLAPAISPSGRYLAVATRVSEDNFILEPKYSDRIEPNFRIAVIDLENPSAAPSIIAFRRAYVYWIEWANDDRLLANIGFRVVAIDRDGKNEAKLFENTRIAEFYVVATEIVHTLPDDPKHILMGSSDEFRRYNLYKANVYTGETEIVARGTSSTDRWLTDLQGVPRVRWDRDSVTDVVKVLLRRGNSDEWDVVTQYRDTFEEGLKLGGPLLKLVGFSDDPRIAIVASRGQGDRYSLYEYDTISRTLGRQVFQHPRVDVGWPHGEAIYDPYTTKLLGFTLVDDVWLTHYLDPEWKVLQQRLDAAMPDAPIVSPISWSTDRKRTIVFTQGPTDPGSYYIFDSAKNSLSPIGKTRPNLPSNELGQMVMINYTARDGAKIPGYLTLPPGKGSKNLPMVVVPHGGPEIRDFIAYDAWTQVMATRGYAVFHPNFRGSGGYGRTFTEAGYRQWGRRMQDDITDGVKALIKDGTADPNRICIAGWSFGGYAALAGGAFTPDLYKCVISVAGISDISLVLSDVRIAAGANSYSYDYLKRWVGDPAVDADLIKSTSPVNFASQFKAPVLLVHGEFDEVVRPHHSVMMDKALFKAGKKSKLVHIDRYGHTLNSPRSRLKLYQETEQFLAEHIGR